MPLKNEIIAEIHENGPISVSRYMQLCLSHPKYGYYITQNPLGRDFTTSPEISQIFGEVLGVWGYLKWQEMGSPLEYNLVEIGAGRGTLMRDALKVLAKTKPHIHIVDINPVLKAVQKETLKNHHVTWHDTLDTLDNLPTILIANELLDCLPVNQYVKKAGKWFERRVGESDGKFHFGLSPTSFKHETGDFYEDPIGFAPLFQSLQQRQMKGLFIDYGYNSGNHFDSLQAMKVGQFVDPLEDCGEVDLTAHVNFTAFKNEAEKQGFKTEKIDNQHNFLIKYGAIERLQALQKQNPSAAQKLQQDLTRLIDNSSPDKMGVLFKVLEIGT